MTTARTLGTVVLLAALGGTAQSAQSHRAEGPLLQRALDAPDDPVPQLALAAYYYRVLRFVEAEARATAAAEIFERYKASKPPVRDNRRLAGRDVPEPPRRAPRPLVYPPDATAEGIVLIEYALRSDGRVRDAKVVRSVDGLDGAAREYVRSWEFDPISEADARELVFLARINFTRSKDATAPNFLDLAGALMKMRRFDEAGATLTAARDLIRKRVADCDAEPRRIEPGSGVMGPRKTFDVRPQYPEAARRDRQSGFVIIETVIGRSGKVCAATVVKPVPGLEEAALDAVRKWEYTPTVVDGSAVPVVLTVTVNFAISGPAPVVQF